MGNFSSKKVHKRFKSKKEKFRLQGFETKKEFDEREHLSIGIIKEIFKGNFSSPIQDILSNPNSKILDVGCGAGFWLTDMATDYPKPSFIGVDAEPNFPKSTIPHNIKFFQYNILEGLPFEDNTFDFIHLQFLFCDFTESQWENIVYKEIARLLKPGGWLEITDPDIETKNCGPTTKKLDTAVCNHLKSNNFNPNLSQHHRSFIKSVPSFAPSIVYHKKVPLKFGSHGDKIGKINTQYVRDIHKHIYMSPIGRQMKIKQEDIESNLDLIESEFEEYKSFLYIHRYYVMKSENEV